MDLDDLVGAARPFEARLGSSLGEHWFERLDRHFSDSYAGVQLMKFPEDLRVYEHLLWQMRPDTVIEIGTASGGSALWLRDRLADLSRYGGASEPRVISIDVEPQHAAARMAAVDPDYERTITLLEGDVLDPALPGRVREIVGRDARCLVIEDSAHVYDTTLAALRGFADFVPPGGWFVVEDGCIDVPGLRPQADEGWPSGVLPAIEEWLASPAGAEFTRRRDVEAYGLTSHPGGYLQRRG